MRITVALRRGRAAALLIKVARRRRTTVLQINVVQGCGEGIKAVHSLRMGGGKKAPRLRYSIFKQNT